MRPIKIKRKALHLRPDQSRVLLRPFDPGERTGGIVARIMALPESEVGRLVEEVCDEFCERHSQIHEYFQERFDQISGHLSIEVPSAERQQLIGSYFSSEFSPESAALFNPSIVPHPDQSHLPPGALRFVLSVRAVGEGHISSLTFRSGVIYSDHGIEINNVTGYLTEPRQIRNPSYKKPVFVGRLQELDLTGDITSGVMRRLEDSFSLEQLRSAIADESAEPHDADGQAVVQMTVEAILMVATSNYEVRFDPDQRMSERIIFPTSPAQSNGIEDARFVQFQNEDGTHVYYATVTAFDGHLILPELVETPDFLHFRFSTLSGPAAKNKGMALFPRKIDGRYAMISRLDNENLYLVFSDNIHSWHDPQQIITPQYPWGLVQLGNCGSPIETESGWLVLTHGVGPMRKYCIGAFLLDRDNPVKVIGRLHEPLLKPSPSEREGYVPNVVYTCGSLIHNDELIIPYGLSDHSTSFATASLDDVLAAME